jgi:uncharacterized protein (TIGR02147 family)
MKQEIYKYNSYRLFLRDNFPQTGSERGKRSLLAKSLRCQSSLISLVVTQRAHFNEDMAFGTCQFLEMDASAQDFFLLLFHKDRAGTEALKKHYQSKIEKIRKQRNEISERVKTEPTLALEYQTIYYSSWIYSAVHTLVLNPKMRTASEIAKVLTEPQRKVEEAIEFLLKVGLLANSKGALLPGVQRLHLSSDSPLLAQHQSNWHLEALRRVRDKNKNCFSYSGILSMSKADSDELREMLLDFISRLEEKIKPSPDEQAAGIVIDFFPYGL